jgi:hypothetical protein
VTNGADLSGMKGRFVEVRTTLTTNAKIGERDLPILKDLTIEHHPLTMTLDIPDWEYDHGFAPFDLDDFLSFDDPAISYDDVVWSYSDLPEGWTVVIDVDHVVTVTGPEDATEEVAISFSAHLLGMDECGVSDEVVFIPNHPPELCDSEAFVCLWPPNHKYQDIPLTPFVCDPDGDEVTVSIISITSDELTAKNPKDKKAPDAAPDSIGTDTARVRSERNTAKHADGRVYVVTFLADDGRGGETEITLPVRVPLNKKDYKDECAAIDSGQDYDATEISLGGGKKKKK